MARKANIVILVFCTVIQLSLPHSLPSDKSYHAAVVEFSPSQLKATNKAMEENTLNIKNIIESTVTDNLDIIVFPEDILTNMDFKTFVPDPKENIAPCDIPDYDIYLAEISCAARSRQVYVVINILEQAHCKVGEDYRCPSSAYYTFNTNVVFDRNGIVISRYRKTHLYGYEWYRKDVLEHPELATFNTDFGVTFGHFICFDMLFYDPAMRLIRELNITDIIYPTYWYSQLPFLTSIQLQEGWAYANNVNLLAAGASIPSETNTGSGIFVGNQGRISATINEEPTTKVIRAEVPKIQFRSEFNQQPESQTNATPSFETARFTKLNLMRDYNVDIFSTKLLPADFTEVQNEVLCHNDFCCNFDINRVFIAQSSMHSAYRYRLASYYGDETTFGHADPSAMAVCAVIACTTDALYSCGHIFPAAVVVGNTHYFSKLDITGTFPKAERRLLMPTTVDGQMMPVPVSNYDMLQTDSDASTKVSMSLKAAKADLLTFGIWGNYFSTRTSTHNLRPMELIMPSRANATRPGSGSRPGNGTRPNFPSKSSGLHLSASLFFVCLAYVLTKDF